MFNYRTNSGNDLEQMTSNLKGNVQVYKYLQMKKKFNKKQKQSNLNYFKQQYQEILQERGRKRFVSSVFKLSMLSVVIRGHLIKICGCES